MHRAFWSISLYVCILYNVYCFRFCLGSGLMVASRFPILEAEFTPFTHKKEQLLKLWIPDIVLICLVRYTVWYYT
jgi:hypothetical protein